MPVISGPFGLLGFGTATTLLNLANVGAFHLSNMNLAMGLALGCCMQFVGSIIAYVKGEFFAAFAFGAYATFWFSFILTFLLPGPLAFNVVDNFHAGFGWYLCIWGIFTLAMLIAVWKPKSNWALRIVFITLVILFLLLAISEWCADTGYADSSNKINTAAGAVGILCGVDAFYIALAEAINNCYERTILPLGEVLPPKEAEPASPPPVIAGPFGLLGFGTATTLLNLANVGAFHLSNMNLAMGLALGCCMQFYGSIVALRRGEFFAAFAFGAYATFWFSFILIFLLPGPLAFNVVDNFHAGFGWYLCIWGIFTLAMLIAVWKPKSNLALRIVFITLVILFGLLAISEWCADTGHPDASNLFNTAAGAVGLVCGVDAFYIALAEAVNNCWGFTIFPIGEILPSQQAEPASPPPVIAGPFGLLGFGTATTLLNLANVGAFHLSNMNLAMGLALGCCMQFYGAVIALIQGQANAAFAFGAYATFWFSFILTFLLPGLTPDTVDNFHAGFGWYLCIWGVYTLAMTIVFWKPKSNFAIRIVFVTLVVLFGLLAISEWCADRGHPDASNLFNTAAGVVGILCGVDAFYIALAEAVNNCWGYPMLPIGEVLPEKAEKFEEMPSPVVPSSTTLPKPLLP